MSIYETDIWRVGIVKAPMTEVISNGVQEVHWFKEEGSFKFLADPFGVYENDRYYVFAEAYDYRSRHGHIEVMVLDSGLNLLDRRAVLSEPWHLSYPMLVKDQGIFYMLPEAYKSGATTLYKAVDFPYVWEKVPSFSFSGVAIDPTLFFHDGLWWMFYTPVIQGLSRQSVLSVAWSETLTGVWHEHVANPVRISPSSARPGGNAVMTSQGIILPVQDCTWTYGGGVSFLNIIRLTVDSFEARIAGKLQTGKALGNYSQGVHTLSAMGSYCLIDAKKIINQPFKRFMVDRYYQFNKWI